MSWAKVEQAIKDLPTLPRVPTRALEILRTSELGWAEYSELVELIKSDPVVSGKLIALANATGSGVPMRFPNVRLAVLRLGTTRLITLMESIGLCSAFASSTETFDVRAFWSYSLATALVAERVAVLMEEDSELSYQAGISHRVGVALLATRFPCGFASALQRREESLDAALEAEFGFAVPALSAEILRRWTFDSRVVCAVAHQEQPAEAGEMRDLAWAIRSARWCTETLGLGIGGESAKQIYHELPEYILKQYGHGTALGSTDLLQEHWPFLVDIARCAMGTFFDD